MPESRGWISARNDADLSGRVLVHRTSADTQGLLAAVDAGASPVLAGSFLTAAAIVRHLQRLGADQISLVALEDMLCADYLHATLFGKAPDFPVLCERIRNDPSGQRFFDPELPWFPMADSDVCKDLERFDAAVVAVEDETFGMRLEAVSPTC